MIALFLVLAFFAIGGGGLFSSNVFTIILACLVFALALSLMDIWEMRMPAFFSGGKASVLMQREGPVGAFFKGVLTTILASSCGAPLMSTALQFAKDQSDAGNDWVVYVVYGKDDVAPGDHPANKNVELHFASADGGESKTIVKLFGGQGTMNVNSWAPDNRTIAFVSYRLKE